MRKLLTGLTAALLMTACAKEIINQPRSVGAQQTTEMGKVLSIYGGFTAQQLKDRASIPSQADITVNADNIVCGHTDIPTEIKAVIGESTNDCGSLCISPKINKWSGFGPREWYYSGGVLLDRAKYPYDMANFCGYNHNAVMPYLNCASSLLLSSSLANTSFSLPIQVNLGEVNWFANLGLTTCHIVVDGVIKSSFDIEAGYIGNYENTVNVLLSAPAIGTSQAYTIETWFGAVANKQGKLLPAGNSITLTVLVSAEFTSLLVIDSPANRTVIQEADFSILSTEYVAAIYTTLTNKSISTTNLSGKYQITAELRFNDNGGYSRTINVPAGGLINCSVNCYKVNGSTSSMYNINSNYRLMNAAGGTSFDFAIPTALKPILDGDKFYIQFDQLN